MTRRSIVPLLCGLSLWSCSEACGGTNHGSAIGEDDGCTHTPEGMPNIRLVGSFAHDRGCSLSFVEIDGDEVSGDDISPQGLAELGWARAEPAQRRELAMRWVRDVLAYYEGGMIQTPDEAFGLPDTPSFSVPSAETTEDGGVIVSAWFGEPSGMVFESTYHYCDYRFDRRGRLQADCPVTFTVPGERLQRLRPQ